MAGMSRQKQKLLLLKEMLESQTDENHSLTVAQIISKLEAMGIKAERKTVYDDIATLQDFGVDVVCKKDGHSNAYSVLSRDFQLEELYVLVDAVSSCKFLTIKKSNELIEKIKKLTSKYLASGLERSIYINNRPRSTNDAVYYNINAIHSAISSKKKLSFKYFTYNEKCNAVFKHGDGSHVVTPLYVVWDNDSYYFIAHNPSASEGEMVRTYRVDRMQKVKELSDDADDISSDELDFAKSLRGTFSMFKSETRDITLYVKQPAFNAVIDKFGKSIRFREVGDDFYSVDLQGVSVSPTFWGWLFTFGENAKVVAPASVVAEAKKEIKKLAENYA